MDKYDLNRRYFGHDSFRPGQETLIDAILAGRDVLGIMPTGGGKSLCYQIPALLLPGLTLVVSPLISLMKDQVSALRQAGLPAACLNSAMELEEYRATLRQLRAGRYKLLYVAPERLDAEGFFNTVRQLEVSLLAVDEAHCISQWGQDFRPSYLQIPAFTGALKRRPVTAAFTATATGEVREDIVRLLDLREPDVLVTGFDRPNLFFEVRRPENKMEAVLELIRQRPGRSGIVYCATRAKVESVCLALQAAGIPATRYHAGLSDEERQHNQEEFQFDRAEVMVATNAFGMGIDKSNVSFVIHYNMPKSLEAYYQEAGRAGRDGERAQCVLLFSPGDVQTARFLIEHGGENDALSPEQRQSVRQRDYRRLEAMAGYCKTRGCLRGKLLDYFGQEHPERCGSCGNCRAQAVWEDITVPAQMVLSCVRRIEDKLHYCVGAALLARVLRGGRDKRVLELGLDKLSTYGLMRDKPVQQVRDYIDYLKEQGYLAADPQCGAVRLTGHALEVLYRGEKVSMPVRRQELPAAAPVPAAHAAGADEGLFTFLKTVRTQIAREEQVPAYIVFTNASLREIAARRPRTRAELLEVPGVGEVKARRYGERFLSAVAVYGQLERDRNRRGREHG